MTERKAPTSKQQTVLDLIAKGKTPAQIASRMQITIHGVYNHTRALRELGYLTEDNEVTVNGNGADADAAVAASTNGSSTDSLQAVEDILTKAKAVATERQMVIENRVAELNDAEVGIVDERNALLAEAEALEQRIQATV